MTSGSDETECRADVWLWRARFCKTRALAAALLSGGRVRWFRGRQERRLEKPSAALRIGDELLFVLGGKVVSLRIEGLGERRGPATEARALYALIADAPPEA